MSNVSFSTPSGKRVDLEIALTTTTVKVDGRSVGTAWSQSLVTNLESRFVTPKLRDAVKAIGGVALLQVEKDVFALTAVTIGAIEAAYVKVCAEYELSPAFMAEQRRQLTVAVASKIDSQARAREAAYQNDTGRGWNKVSAIDAEITAAEKALAEFDATHPEVIASIEAERAAASERFLAAD